MKQPIDTSGCIGIVGLGLIGGSLGLELQSIGLQVRGLVHRPVTAERAKARGLAQKISTNSSILNDCDLVILAIPLDKLINPSSDLIGALPKSAVVTDVGSVKGPVLNTWRELHPKFVASHPMAGTAESGVESGKIGLFNKRPWITTPESNTDLAALEKVHQLAIALGSHWITTNSEKHDQAVALISHLPMLVSTALLQTLDSENDHQIIELSKIIASSGFEDTTRIGGGNPELGTSMAMHNTSALLETLSSYRRSLNHLEEVIVSKQWNKFKEELQHTKAMRSSFIRSVPKVNVLD